MNYPESISILEEIKKAQKILVNFHKSPDGDSVGGALAMLQFLKKLGKEVKIISVDGIPHEYLFLPGSNLVSKTDISTFDFSEYDLFLALDSSVWTQVVKTSKVPIPDISIVVIDHHFTNSKFGKINLVDPDRSSTAEVLYRLFNDWDVEFNKEIATCLLTGLVYDTSSLQNPAADVETAEIFAKLMSLGADKDEIIFNMYRSLDLEKVKALSELLGGLKLDKEHNFVWAAFPYGHYKKYSDIGGVKTIAANLFASSIKDTNFGIIMIEESENSLHISIRGRTDVVDTSLIASEFGGGGHKKASGARIDELPFNEAVEKVLEAARKHAKEAN